MVEVFEADPSVQRRSCVIALGRDETRREERSTRNYVSATAGEGWLHGGEAAFRGGMNACPPCAKAGGDSRWCC